MHAIQHRTQNYDTTDDASLSCINLTDSAAAACFRGFAVAGWARPVSDRAHLHAVQKLRGACDELIAKKETFEVIALSAVDVTEIRDQAEEILRAAGCAYARAIAKAQIAKSQVAKAHAEMTARILAEQEAVAERRGSAAIDHCAGVVPAAITVLRPLRRAARRAADVILFRKRTAWRIPLAA